MGITGLIPFMEKASCQANVSMFKGGCAAIDAYCWLHRGAYTCAEKLARGEPTTAYVVYCMKFVNMLLSHNIKPIMVFDGRHLPAKAGTEKKRRESREVSRKRAAELLRAGRTDEARNYLRRCIDISHEMALTLIQECRRRNVDCIVAPYEADAELGYLNMKNIAQVVITEDSDLILFGCTKILFKMDINGNGILVERERLHLSMGCRVENFDFDKFRYMCILSGCDYLPSLPGIGLGKACKFVKRTSDPDIHKALARMPMFLNMLQLPMTPEYRDEFLRADATFRYQLVFDPLTRSQTTLTETPPNYKPSDFTGKRLPNDVAYQLALGNLDPFTLNQMDTFDPDKSMPGQGAKTTGWNQSPLAPHASIWRAGYKVRPIGPSIDPRSVERPATKGKVVNLRSPLKKVEVPDTSLSNTELASMYGESPPSKKLKLDADEIGSALLETTPKKKETEEEPLTSPVITSSGIRRNPFVKGEKKKVVVETVPSPVKYKCKFSALERLSKRKDASCDGSLVQSRYFASEDGRSPSKTPRLKTSLNVPEGSDSPPGKRPSRSPIKKARRYITNDGRTIISPVKEFFKEFDPESEKVNVISLSNPHEDGENAFIKEEIIGKPLHSQRVVPDHVSTNSSCGKKNLMSSFNWGSLHDKFGYTGPKRFSLKSTPSVTRDFKIPTVANSIPGISVDDVDSLLEEQSVDDPGELDNSQINNSYFGSQGTSIDTSLSKTNGDSSKNVFSDEGYKSLTPTKPVIVPSKPSRLLSVGLSKSKSNLSKKSDPKQQTLLNMFGFKGNTKKIVRQ